MGNISLTKCGTLRRCGLALLSLVIAEAAAAEVSTYYDGFDAPTLDAGWTLVDGYALNNPADTDNHATVSLTGTHLSIDVPGGVEHNQWIFAHTQLTRSHEGSGVYEFKVDSAMVGNQQFGLVFQSDPNTFLMFMMYGTDRVKVFVERFVNTGGVQYKQTLSNTSPAGDETGLALPQSGPFYNRVILQDDPDPTSRTWKWEWSLTGSVWNTVTEGVLETALPEENIGAIQAVGIFAGNHVSGTTAFDALFDYYATYPIADLPLPAPSSLIATPSNERVDLSWDPVEGAEGYRVLRAVSAGGPYSPITATAGTSYSDLAVTNGVSYYYVVTSLQGLSETGYSLETIAVPHIVEALASLPSGGLTLLLSADELLYTMAAGAPVLQWPDVSGSGVAGLAGSGHAPTLVDGALNGRPVVRFDGQDDYMQLTSGFSDFSAGLTMFLVMRPEESDPDARVIVLGNGDGQDNIVLTRNGPSGPLQYGVIGATGFGAYVNTVPALVDGEAAIYSLMQDADIGQPQSAVELRKDGVSIGTGTAFQPPVTSRDLNYLGRGDYAWEVPFSGDIAEVILYDRILNEAEQLQVEAYLDARYFQAAPPPAPAPEAVPGLGGTGALALLSLLLASGLRAGRAANRLH